LRKTVEEMLYRYTPGLGWATQYARMSFGNERYSEVEKATERQGKVLAATFAVTIAVVLGLGAFSIWRVRRFRAVAGKGVSSLVNLIAWKQ
jgi:kynurenine 3-monooxygenase